MSEPVEAPIQLPNTFDTSAFWENYHKQYRALIPEAAIEADPGRYVREGPGLLAPLARPQLAILDDIKPRSRPQAFTPPDGDLDLTEAQAVAKAMQDLKDSGIRDKYTIYVGWDPFTDKVGDALKGDEHAGSA